MNQFIKSPVTFDVPSVVGFVAAVAIAVIIAKRLPVVGKAL